MATVLALPAELTIYTVGELRTPWLTWLGDAVASSDDTETLVADAAAVDQVDTAGVQLLLSLSSALRGQGRALHVTNPGGPLGEACALLGVAALLFGQPAEAEA